MSKNIADLLPIGHRVYTLTIKTTGKHIGPNDEVTYDYEICPVVNRVKEIRIGRAMTQTELGNHYGPMAYNVDHIGYPAAPISYLANPDGEPFILTDHVFSPNKDHLVGHGKIAGVDQRGYLTMSQLRPYAEEVRDAALKELPNPGTVTISDEIPK